MDKYMDTLETFFRPIVKYIQTLYLVLSFISEQLKMVLWECEQGNVP